MKEIFLNEMRKNEKGEVFLAIDNLSPVKMKVPSS